MKRFVACVLALASAFAHARDALATLTILDGRATLLRAASKWPAPEGLALEAEDIIETAPSTALARIEFDTGAALDLGPNTRVLLRPQMPASAGVLVYVLTGWAKLSQGPTPGGAAMLASPWIDVRTMERDVVLHTAAKDAALFAESGAVQTQVVGKGTQAVSMKTERGAFLARAADGAVNPGARPTAAFIQAVPRAFMDTLPLRRAQFAGKDIRLGTGAHLSYDDAQAWLDAEPRVRGRFIARWKPLLQDAAFRRSLIDQMTLHPEWRPVVFPPSSAAHGALPGPAHSSATSSSPAVRP